MVLEKVKLFTHTDLDGVGCSILCRLGYSNVDVEYCEPTTINDQITNFLKRNKYKNYSKVIITDISVNLEVANEIQRLIKDKCILLDHHKTAEWLNEFQWAKVVTHSEIGMECGTNLLKGYLKGHKLYKDELDNFVESIRRYDTWEWKSRFNDIMSKQLNDLFNIYGRDEFADHLIKQLRLNGIFRFSHTDQMLLKMKEEQYKRYFDRKQSSLMIVEIGEYSAGIVFAEQYISELGNELAEKNPNCDFIAMIMPDRGVEYRTIRDDIDLGAIARTFGGGGHPKAAGSPVTLEKRKIIVDIFFSLNK